MTIQKEEQAQNQPDREAESETHKPPYEKPVIMSLGEFARGWGGGQGKCDPSGGGAHGQCRSGGSAHGGCSPSGASASHS